MREQLCRKQDIKDYGAEPLVINIEQAAENNNTYRTALWTGEHMQVTLMCIPAGGDIGPEIHPHTEQFIRIESGCALAVMGKNKELLNIRQKISGGCAVIVPAGTWHNIINIGKTPLKLYSVYAPVQHPFGTVQETKMAAELEESR